MHFAYHMKKALAFVLRKYSSFKLRPPLRNYAGRWSRKLAPPGITYVDVNVRGLKFPLCVDTNSNVGYRLFYYSEFEPGETRVIGSILSAGDVFVDVGANVGYYTVLGAKLVGLNGEVHAFEPSPDSIELLKKSVEASGLSNIFVNEIGLFDRKAELPIFLSSKNIGSNSFAEVAEQKGSAPAKVITLDAYVKEHKLDRIDVIKMDIESAEFAALQGMKETLQKFHPKMLIEINPERLAAMGSSAEELMKLLESFGYSSKLICKN